MPLPHGNFSDCSDDELQTLLNKEEVRELSSRLFTYDFCINYFHEFKVNGEKPCDKKNLEKSLLHLGFYLASWGMYRGSSFLHKQSLLGLQGAVEAVSEIAASSPAIWDLDVEKYSEPRSVEIILETKSHLKKAFGNHGPSETLITKIMLGVFGIVPAFDTYFKKATGLRVLDEKSIATILQIYEKRKALVNRNRQPTKNINGCETTLRYSQAKVIDLIYFAKGKLL